MECFVIGILRNPPRFYYILSFVLYFWLFHYPSCLLESIVFFGSGCLPT